MNWNCTLVPAFDTLSHHLFHLRYLPSFPYQDDPLLHLYAGLTALYLAHSPPTPEPQNSKSHIARRELDHLECAIAQNQFDTTLFRYAQTNFERANCLDPDSAIAQAFLEKVLYSIAAHSIVISFFVLDDQVQP